MDLRNPFSRRTLLGGALAGAAGVSLAAAIDSGSSAADGPRRPKPGTLPNPDAAAGTDQLPLIKNIVVVMLENHSYDNILGMMRGRGDGFRLRHGKPTASNPAPHDMVQHAFLMPTPCQLPHQPFNTWDAAHQSFADGRMDGFVKSPSGPVSMGYFDDTLLPFAYSLAKTFPVCDRYFCSVMAQTYPNRRYLAAGTSLGQVSDTLSASDKPPNGTIFEALNKHGISWNNYYSSLPSAAIWLYLLNEPAVVSRFAHISQFFSDAAAGTLPAFSLVDPDFGTQSEENPQDVQYGDQFLANVVNAAMSSPQWKDTMLVWTYDEHGGYYDHVPPPKAPIPDDVKPLITVPPDRPGGFGRYGFRVPAGVVSPYARRNYVSHVVHDHTSILKLISTKWNLPAFTYRDAAADDMLDSVDLKRPPAFLEPPTLAAPADPSLLAGCLTTGPGVIPPPGSVTRG